MSILSKEIQTYLREVTTHEDGRITAEVTFPESFTGFKGHFPNKPVVPGVCKVMCVLALLEMALKKKVQLKTMVLAKFMSLVTSNETLKVELRGATQGQGSGVVKGIFSLSDKKIAEVHIEVNYE